MDRGENGGKEFRIMLGIEDTTRKEQLREMRGEGIRKRREDVI